MSAATILLIIMWIFAGVFLIILFKDVIAHKNELDKTKTVYNAFVSMVANFFDTLGIGSYAIATSAWKFNKAMPDDLIPGTLNVACRTFDTGTHDRFCNHRFRNRRQDYFQNGYYEDPGCYGCCSYHRSRHYTM